ncbi:hypothetical protein ABT001_29160 [Streptomyces sp. NPDC002793]|uniref:hypothetical protein n=1 Tax=Streptomyces sp. NPDC002793 TaxID=3154432 RepID=UPI003317B8F2
MPTTTLDQATSMIENAWGQPLKVLEGLADRCPNEDPLLSCAIQTRTALAMTDKAVTVHQDRLHALSRHGYVPDFYELDRITTTAVSLRVARSGQTPHAPGTVPEPSSLAAVVGPSAPSTRLRR